MWPSMESSKPKKGDKKSDVSGSEVIGGGVKIWDSGFLSEGNIRGSSGLINIEETIEGDNSKSEAYSSSSLSPVSKNNVGEKEENKEQAEEEEEEEEVEEASAMRANDSGVIEVVGLSDKLSNLTLKPVTLNRLRGKIQSEPTNFELTPVISENSDKNNYEENLRNEIDSSNIELWQLYFSQDEDGDTQLHVAIVQGFHEVALSLIRMAPHPSLFDCLNHKRQSPLHLAVLTHQSSLVRRLVLAGADPGLRNSDGNTALHLASASGDIACARALTYPLQLTERVFLVPGRQAPVVPQDLEQRNYEGETCLHAAVVAGNTELVRLLLRVGADLEAKERLGGRTALHLAIECRREGVTNLLLNECRPQLNALTYAGITPYEIAAAWNSQLAKELVKLGAQYEKGTDDLHGKIPTLWHNVTLGLRV